MRQTSIDAFRKIESEGLLSKRRFQVYKVLFEHGPLTTGEVWWGSFKDIGISQNSINPRMSELLKQGVIHEAGTRHCRVTGQTCIEWDVTDRLPVELKKEKKVTDTQRLDWLINNNCGIAKQLAGRYFVGLITDNNERVWKATNCYDTPREAIDAAMKESN